MCRRDAEDVRPRRPRIVGGTIDWRARKELELMNRSGALTVSRAEAVRARVAAADDDDILVFGGNSPRIVDSGHIVAFAAAVRLGQIFHREVNAPKVAPWNVQIARGRR